MTAIELPELDPNEQIPTSFEDLLPVSSDPVKTAIRGKLVYILNSQGEILPPANSPLGKLWRLVNSPQSSVQECEEVIELDPALASRIFRVANSAAYGATANNISDAIFRIGFTCVREQAFNAGVFTQFSGLNLPPEWDLFWLRNIFVARLCEKMAAKYSSTDGSEYLAGLIHDMGWLFLATYFPKEFTAIFTGGKPVREAEKEFLPFGHADITGAIATRSLLPLRAVNAILHHHDPMTSAIEASIKPDQIEPAKNPRFLAVILNLGDQIADCCQMNMFGETTRTIEEIQQSPEGFWLNHFGAPIDLRALAEEELVKSQEIFDVFFAR
ncbi:MAG TPA: HDOD domain-containing protein [Candidatus Methylacidiphilales bacterium]